MYTWQLRSWRMLHRAKKVLSVQLVYVYISVLTNLCDGCDDLQKFKSAVSHIPVHIVQAFVQDRTQLINGGTLKCVHEQSQVRRHEVLDRHLHQLQSLHRQLQQSPTSNSTETNGKYYNNNF